MPSDIIEIPEEVEEKRSMADWHRQQANKLEQEAFEVMQDQTRKFMYELQDKLLNRTESLDYLPIDTLQSLKTWEKKYSQVGYLIFDGNKILRSKLLEFIDDYNSGKVHQKLRKRGLR